MEDKTLNEIHDLHWSFMSNDLSSFDKEPNFDNFKEFSDEERKELLKKAMFGVFRIKRAIKKLNSIDHLCDTL